MSPGIVTVMNRFPCFPRVSGDEPENIRLGYVHLLFSPRERG